VLDNPERVETLRTGPKRKEVTRVAGDRQPGAD
jgi:hypothetical protein